MKKLLLVLLLGPLLMATQCEDDDEVFLINEYYIQNNTSVELVFLSLDENQIPIPVNSREILDGATENLLPSNNPDITDIKLYTTNANNSITLVYEQNPINDDLWVFSENSNGDVSYTLTITDADLN